ncbi:MAG: hypothetical protein V3W44_09625 [Dehalococcoidales bacterium]
MPNRFRIGGHRGSKGGSSWDIPRFDVELPTEAELAMAAAEAELKRNSDNLRAGKAADGTSKSLKESTIRRRKHTPGSRGGSTPFYDTGRLINGLRVVGRGSTATVEVSGDRQKAATDLANMGRDPLGVHGDVLDQVLARFLDKALR